MSFAFRALLLGLALLTGCADPPLPDSGPAVATIYVVERGWHTDIGLPAGPPLGTLRPFEKEFPGARFFVFGFGERGYLEARDKTPGVMLRALFPSEGMMLVTALNASPEVAFATERVVALPVSQAALDGLTRFIAASISWSPNGRPLLAGAGPYAGSLFYASPGQYDLFDTCNTWTARALQAAGEPVSPAGVVLAGQVVRQLDGLAGRRVPPVATGAGS